MEGILEFFFKMLAEEGETWDVYKVVSDEFSDDDEVGDYDGFVITGSCSDAHGNESWICKLVNLVKKLDSMRKKIMGICFGHQILCRALGGKTERSHTGWDIGVRTINLSSSTLSFSFLQLPSKLAIIECHQDEVMELPDKAEVIAWSDKTEIEMFRYGDHIPGTQGHPEYNKDILINLIDQLLERDEVTEDFAEEMKTKILESQEPDKEAWERLYIGFHKGGI